MLEIIQEDLQQSNVITSHRHEARSRDVCGIKGQVAFCFPSCPCHQLSSCPQPRTASPGRWEGRESREGASTCKDLVCRAGGSSTCCAHPPTPPRPNAHLSQAPKRDTALRWDIQVVPGDLGMNPVTSQHNGQKEAAQFSSLGSGFARNPPITPLRIHPSPWGLLTQSSIQVLEDTAAVVQGDIDLLLQERGYQAAAGTGPGGGWGYVSPSGGNLSPSLGPLPPHLLCHITSG